VVHIRHLAVKPGSTFFLPDSPGSQIQALVQPAPEEPIVIKHFPNAFRETELLEVLGRFGAKRLVIAGMMTHMCVDATTRAACDLGFECTVVANACAAPGQDFEGTHVPPEHVHASFLAALSGSYAKVVNSGELL
jgi:nicotinamidase-related amidase